MARPRRFGSDDDTPKVKLTKDSLRQGLLIFRYLKPYRQRYAAGLVFILLSSLTTMSFPYLLKELIGSAQAQRTGVAASPSPISSIANTPGTIALLMIGVLALQMVFSFGRIVLFSQVGENAVADMRKDIYQRLIRMPMDFFGQRRVGELSSRISADVTQIQDTVTATLAELLRGLLTFVIGFGLLIYLSWALTLRMLAVVPVIIVIALLFSRYIRKTSRQAQDQLAESNTVVQETLQGIATVKAFANEWFERLRYGKNIKSAVDLAIKNAVIRGVFVSFMIFSVFGAIVLCIWYGSRNLPFDDLTAFVLYTAFVAGSLAGFADLYGQLQKTIGATERVRELLQEPVEEVELDEEPIAEGFRIHGNVELRNVEFHYPSRPETIILKNVNLEVSAGQQIAIVGPSGAGKSTMASLLLSFYQPSSGQILYDGKSANAYPLTQLRKQIALVPQDVLLFGGTIFENIAYGKPEATQEEIENAARQANAHDFISRFPEGYKTVVGERGVKLSGGQRQRIAIARAILKDPAILILDEATSSLDSESEALVQEALHNLMKNRTSFVIAHRLSTIRNADKIVVLEQGQIAETGRHAELMQVENGIYRNLSRLQTEWNMPV